MTAKLKTFPSRSALVLALADQITTLLCAGIDRAGRASLAVSGGSTPLELFEHLSKQDIPWQQVVITLVDERWVSPTDRDSNQNLVQKHLCQNKARTALFVGLKNDAPTAHEGEKTCEQALEQVPRPFDALILGMGNDGHTASLFPGAAELGRATSLTSGRTCMAITPPEAPHARMTLTLPAILDARHIFLHITGREKKAVLEKALQHGPAQAMPIRSVLNRQPPPLSIYWAP